MAPVIDVRDEKANEYQAEYPGLGLLKHLGAPKAPLGFSKKQQGANQAADPGRGTNGQRYISQAGEVKSRCPGQGIDGEHPGHTELMDDQRSYVAQGNHVEDNVQQAAVEPVGREQTPPGVVLVDGNGARGTHKGGCLKRWGQGVKGVQGQTGAAT